MIPFVILAVLAIFGAVMVVTRKSPVASAVYLVMVMVILAGLFVLLGAYFLAAFQIIVYAGAIMVLFLFVIMLLNLRKDEFGRDPRVLQKYLGFSFAVLIMIQSVIIVGWAVKDRSGEGQSVAIESLEKTSDAERNEYLSVESVAETLFTRFAYPFEITSVLLLAAILGAVVIARRRSVTNDEEDV
ncbi:MAG: NADH-quinone oxidoreductase subunit J [candidate division Zixibacteria bacterium]